MYFLSTSAEKLEPARWEMINEIVNGVRADVPFWRSRLMGEPTVLGYYFTRQSFVARVAVAVFPSAQKDRTAEIVMGSFCDWRTPNIERMVNISTRSVALPYSHSYPSRVKYMQWARHVAVLPEMIYDKPDETEAMEAVCAAEEWPSAVLALETVENDSPESPKPELATLYYPMIAMPEIALYSLKTILTTAKSLPKNPCSQG